MKRLLAILALLLPATAHAEWYEATTPHVRVFAKGKEAEARRIADQIERFDSALRYLRETPEREGGPAGRLTIYVVDSFAEVDRLTKGANVAGFYLPRAGGSVAFVPQRAPGGDKLALSEEAVLLHEYTHHFMYRNYTAAHPPWLAEGFAEFHATARFHDDGSVQIGAPPPYRIRGLFYRVQLPIQRLLEPKDVKITWQELDNLYGRGWLLLHYLTFEKTRAQQLAEYLRAMAEGKPSLEAARLAFGDLKTLDRELAAYTRKQLVEVQIPATALKPGSISVRRLTAPEEAMMEVHIVSTSDVDRKQARKLLPKVRKAAQPYPDHPFVQAVMAKAEFDAGNFNEAKAAADRSVAADPKSRNGLLYQSMAMTQLALASEDRSPQTKRATRAPLLAANRLDPDDPRPMLLIYENHRAFGDTPGPDVVKAIQYAHRMAPEDHDLRLTAASEHLRAGEVSRARALVAPLVYDAHAGRQEAATALLALIDAHGTEAADATAGAADTPKVGADEVVNP
ncbi:tetratricopeptide repeat protein [Sphingomonas qomolangmaensis]|uniref:DUF1570 domain-containing protein n=1 Tax=Sphingomonas qomolangmaensis TaxID=2918765 RepID=A0ABY5L700_9SPHN|nr:hypothetical protein [Sphingomonas qomolangmaensis]UUL81662.1 hypothetical protein NMP03_10670 [Sphingomonas qomolangmaensis]